MNLDKVDSADGDDDDDRKPTPEPSGATKLDHEAAKAISDEDDSPA